MKGNIVLFNRGSGGNFLARVLTLDPSTVPLGSDWVNTAEQRCEYYCYRESPGTDFAAHSSQGLSYWVEKELKQMYFPFTRGIPALVDLDKIVNEFIHPHHYQEKIELLGPDDRFDLYYIDMTSCEHWVEQQIKHKIFLPPQYNIIQGLQQESKFLTEILTKNQATPISLANIIESPSTFLQEYVKISCQMNLEVYQDLALKIYNSWKTTWKNLVINQSS